MLEIMLHRDVLKIGDDKPPSSLAEHLETETSYIEELLYYKAEDHAACKAFIEIHSDKSVRKLKFSSWDKTYPALFWGVIIQRYPDIRELDFRNCNLRDTDIPHILVILRACPNLLRINFKENFISNEGAMLLLRTMLDPGYKIKTWDLSDNDIGFQTSIYMSKQLHMLAHDVTVCLEDNHNPDEITVAQQEISSEIVSKERHYLGELADGFKPGDLLYGLHADLPPERGRNPIHRALTRVLPLQAHHQLLVINPFSDWVINRKNLERVYKKDLVRFDAFAKEITPNLYPSDLSEPFLKGWTEHKAICKIGILWAKKNSRTIHYVLDDLHMEAFSNSNRNRADTSVSESEVKFIARFWSNLQENVQFWRTDDKTGNLVKAEPPWLDPKTKFFWEGYLDGERRKMRNFPQGSLSNDSFFKAVANRKQYTIPVYQNALEKLLQNISNKSSNSELQGLLGKYLAQIYHAKNKYQLEKLVFALLDEYKINADKLKDDNLEYFLCNVVKNADTVDKKGLDSSFTYRRSLQVDIYGIQVLDKQALFRLAEQLETIEVSGNKLPF